MGFSEQHTEVAIIGAGIAGLTAAKTFKNYGVPFQLLEASHRIGGRAYSEQLSENNWFDLGCSYLHNGTINPFIDLANKMRFPVDIKNGNLFDSSKTNYFVGGKKINLGMPNPFDRAHNNLLKTIENLQTDKALIEAMDINDPFFPVHCHLSASLNAADPDLVSSKDYEASIYEGPDYPVPKGLGNLVKKWGQNVDVCLNTKVTEINWNEPLIKLKTSKGCLSAKKVILTVSTGVLNGQDIKIKPTLPKKTLIALKNLPMGTLNKVGISFKTPFFSQKERGWYVSWPNNEKIEEQDIGSFQVSTDGPQNAVVFVGGRFGKWLENRGPKAMRDYAFSKIENVFGNGCTQKIQNVITTAWASEPLTKGSYSYAIPGQSFARKELSHVIDRKIHFAGEATETNHYGTVHGAYFSGERVANEIINNL